MKQSKLLPKYSIGDLIETKYPGEKNKIVGMVVEINHKKTSELNIIMYEVLAEGGCFLVLENWIQRIEI